MAKDREPVQNLIRERAQHSKLYMRLGQQQRIIFERVVEAYFNRVLTRATTREIKHQWRMAAEGSGAEDLLDKLKSSLAKAFGVKEGSFNAAIRNTARDVLYVATDPKAHPTIRDLRTVRDRARNMSANEIRPGRQFATRETQPPRTGARTLRRRR